MLPGELATPLAVVLNELMQNAVDHAFRRGDGPISGNVTVRLARGRRRARRSTWSTTAWVSRPASRSSGRGGLGLSIVQTLVTSELGGSIELHERPRHARAPQRPADANADELSSR